MMKWVVKVIIIGLSLFVASWLLPDVQIESNSTLVIAALVLGVINTVIRPILILLTLPITILTFGFFVLVVNVFSYWLTAQLVPGFDLIGWRGLLLGALVTSVVSWILNSLILEKRK